MEGNSSRTPDFLRRLGLTETCSLSEVRAAYRRHAYAAHPDRGGSTEKFKLLCDDYEKAKRYAHAPHKLRPPILPTNQTTGLNPSVNLGGTSNTKRNNYKRNKHHRTKNNHSIASQSIPILVGTSLSGLTAIAAFLGLTLPMELTAAALLVATMGCVYLAVAELAKLAPALAALVFFVVWFSLSALMLVVSPEIKHALAHPEDFELAALPLLALFAYLLVTFFGFLGVLVSMTNKN